MRQYKEALARVDDLRLVILLVFNAFEEVMRAFAAWRLGCASEELPTFLTNTPSYLFQVVQAGSKDKKLLDHIKAFRELRNTVAHGFHLRTWEAMAGAFVTKVLDKAWPESMEERRTVLVDAAFTLAIGVLAYLDELPPRGEWPFPHLSLELVDAKQNPTK